ncbi:MAG: tetratricopeptide repeat protein, partial [Bacteroidia bacterium]|nr:tetratricopeptide repeat protein [Bacteroidia bacterium]
MLYTLQNQYYSTALLLLHSGANPNLKNSNGWSPLHFTASDGQMELTELLIEKGARIDEKDADSWTPLMLAAYMGNNNIYDYLLLHGADKELKNKDGNAASILTDRYFDSIEYNRKLMYQYKNSGDYEKAILYAQKVLLHLEKEYGTQHEEYATALNNLAFLYSNLGDYSTAEPLYKKALDIRKKVLGVEHPDYARSLNSLAELYYYMGNYAAAEPLFKQALEIRKKSLGAEHPDYATSLNNLAALYYEMGNYPAAEPLYQQALEIKKKALGVEHPDYATSLNNLAALYKRMGNYPAAEPMYQQALEITKKAQGVVHPDYATSLNNLAALYERMGNYPAAEPMYQQALEIRKKVLGEEHPGYARSLNSLAALFISNGQPKKAEPYMLAANEILLNQLNIGYQFLSEAEAQLYYTTIAYQFEINNSFIVGRGKDNPSLATLSLNNELALKGASLQASIRMRQSIQDSGDSVLIGTFNQWIGIKIRINDQNNLPIIKRTANVDSLETVANTLEKDLIRSSQVFKGLQASLGIQWKDVQNRLLEKEAAIEFINFQYHNGKKWTDSTQYVALIVRPGDEYPQFINLFEEKQLYEILYYADAPKGRQIRRAITPEIMLQVYELAWQPIEKYLSGVNTVYLSPSGLLTTIPFQALMKDNTTCLIDSLDIQYLLSTRELAIEKPMKESAEPLTAAL